MKLCEDDTQSKIAKTLLSAFASRCSSLPQGCAVRGLTLLYVSYGCVGPRGVTHTAGVCIKTGSRRSSIGAAALIFMPM